MNSTSRAAARFTSGLHVATIYSTTAHQRIALIDRAKVRTDKLQPVIRAASCAADPDERRAQEPHSLAADSFNAAALS
jgi:hypothetical protein